MAYRFRHRESVPQNVRRIAREELGTAVQYLRGRKGVSHDEAIHEARKSIKKVRALMRLVRSGLGPLYKEQSAVLRDTGRKLSQIRDADALIAALDDLRKRQKGKLPAPAVTPIRRALVKHKQHVEDELGIAALLPALATQLAKIQSSARTWPLKADSFPAVEAGLERSYRSGRKAEAVARKKADRESWHEWRKRVKDHWYHIRLLENIWSEVMQGYEQSLKNLQDCLGDDLTLELLREHIAAAPEAHGKPAALALVMKAIEESRKELRESALAFGDRIYGEKPRVLMNELQRLWQTWRDQ